MTDDNTPDCYLDITIAGNLFQIADSINQERQDDSMTSALGVGARFSSEEGD